MIEKICPRVEAEQVELVAKKQNYHASKIDWLLASGLAF